MEEKKILNIIRFNQQAYNELVKTNQSNGELP